MCWGQGERACLLDVNARTVEKTSLAIFDFHSDSAQIGLRSQQEYECEGDLNLEASGITVFSSTGVDTWWII